jgi:hypothetical protein
LAKAKTEETEEATLTIVPANEEVDFGGLAAIMQEYGITREDVTAPVPATPTKQNFEQLCTETSEIVDAEGNAYAKVNGHTGPLMFLEKSGEYDGDKFTGYDGFYVYKVAHPDKGVFVVTLGRPVGEHKPAVVNFLDNLNKGQIFQVASFATSKGFKVFNPVPVQKNGKLLK